VRETKRLLVNSRGFDGSGEPSAKGEDGRFMTLTADLYWSFRSPYSYLGAKHYREISEQFDLEIALRPVYPIAIRNPDFFARVNPLWIPYVIKDCARIAAYRGLPFGFPSPDPIVQDLTTRKISDDQPYIFWLTRLGVEAARRGQGLRFIEEVSTLIWGDAVVDWHKGDHLAQAANRAGLDLKEMESAITGMEADLDAEIYANQDALESAGHWGVPCLVFEEEPFHGQDRIDMAVWRMEQKGLERRG
jgi:2-hydroxychromene-2-carboxylate isomerase